MIMRFGAAVGWNLPPGELVNTSRPLSPKWTMLSQAHIDSLLMAPDRLAGVTAGAAANAFHSRRPTSIVERHNPKSVLQMLMDSLHWRSGPVWRVCNACWAGSSRLAPQRSDLVSNTCQCIYRRLI